MGESEIELGPKRKQSLCQTQVGLGTIDLVVGGSLSRDMIT